MSTGDDYLDRLGRPYLMATNRYTRKVGTTRMPRGRKGGTDQELALQLRAEPEHWRRVREQETLKRELRAIRRRLLSRRRYITYSLTVELRAIRRAAKRAAA